MPLRVIGAGLGRTGTLSLKVALEQLGYGPCYHAMELAANLRQALPLWNHAIQGDPDWEAIFAGYCATTDYPSCCFWPALAAHYPEAKVILTVRDPDHWFDSVRSTIFSASPKLTGLFGPDGRALSQFIRRDLGTRIDDRAFMRDYFQRWNQHVIGSLPPERLLVLSANEGWDRLCAFLHCAVPAHPYPHVHGRTTAAQVPALASDPAARERQFRAYLDRLAIP